MTGVIAVIASGGIPNYKGSATVTVGTFSVPGSLTRYGAEPTDYGSISPANWADSGLPISGLFYSIVTFSPPTTYFVVFRATGYAPNMGWDTHTVDGNTYPRTSASYSFDGTFTTWVWSTTSTNPYGTTIGATKAVSWS